MIQNVSMEVLSCRKEKLHFKYELKFQYIVPLSHCLFAYLYLADKDLADSLGLKS